MPTPLEMVREFHEAFELPIQDAPSVPAEARARLRSDLIEEEYTEWREAYFREDLTAIADSLADLVYVIYGTALEYGIDLDAILEEVHRSNMTKLGDDGRPVRREDGKVLKGPNYEPPRIQELLFGPGSSTPTA